MLMPWFTWIHIVAFCIFLLAHKVQSEPPSRDYLPWKRVERPEYPAMRVSFHQKQQSNEYNVKIKFLSQDKWKKQKTMNTLTGEQLAKFLDLVNNPLKLAYLKPLKTVVHASANESSKPTSSSTDSTAMPSKHQCHFALGNFMEQMYVLSNGKFIHNAGVFSASLQPKGLVLPKLGLVWKYPSLESLVAKLFLLPAFKLQLTPELWLHKLDTGGMVAFSTTDARQLDNLRLDYQARRLTADFKSDTLGQGLDPASPAFSIQVSPFVAEFLDLLKTLHEVN